MNIEDLIKNNERLIYKIASSFYGVEKEDLYQAGCLGLQKAYLNYQKDGKAKFSTYAHDYIFGEMYNLASKKILKINRETLLLYKKIEKARYEYAQKLGYIPSNYELGRILKIDVSLIDNACLSAKELVYLDKVSDDDKNYYETIPKEEKVSLDDKILLYESLEMLPKEEREIIEARYLKDETQDNIARKLKMTQVMVSRLEKKSLNKLREYMSV